MKSSLSQRQLQRRRILQGSSLLMLSPLVKAQSGETLRVGTFGGTFIEAIKATIEPKFKAMTGASVEYVAGGPRDHISKMAAAGGRNVPFDVVDLPADSQADCIKQGLFETVQPSELSNAGKLQPEAWINKGYAPAREWIVSGILYIEERIKAAGLSPNAGFDLLKDPKMAGHVALPEIANPVAPAFIGALAKNLTGDETNIDAALKFLEGVKDPIFFPNFAALQTRFNSGEIWLVPGNLAYISRLKAPNSTVAFLRPPIGDRRAVGYAEGADIVKGTDKRKLAVAWVDAGLDTEVQIAMAKLAGYSPTNNDAAVALGKDPQFAGRFLTTKEDIASMFLPDWSKINAAYPTWVQRWNRVMR